MIRFVITLLVAIGVWGAVQTLAAERLVKKVGATSYRIGEVQFDSKTKQISIPVTVNLRKGGPVEYALVHESGKTHESILTTQVRPSELQIALKLLGYRSGEGHIFGPLAPAEDRKVEGGKSDEPGSSVEFWIKWRENGQDNTVLLNEWIIDGATKASREDLGDPMPRNPWFFTGSMILEGQFLSELEGSIIAIYLDPVAMFNTDVPGSETDERWGANHSVIPEIGTQATLLIHRL